MKTAIVTGGSDGIGKALVCKLADSGFKVVTIGRSAEKLEIVKKYNPELIEVVTGDLTNKEVLTSFIEKVKTENKQIDLLVNNAGFQIGNSELENANLNDIEKMNMIHVTVPLMLYQALFPVLKTTPDSKIINIVSVVVSNYLKETYGPYTITKFGEYGLGKMMVKEATKHNVKVTNVLMGGVETNIRESRRPEYLKPEAVADTLMLLVNAPKSVFIPEISMYPQVQLV